MHPSAYENMRHYLGKYVRGSYFDSHDAIRVVDMGGGDYNGSYRSLFDHPKFEYLAVDTAKVDGVDLVMAAPDRIPLDDGSVDVLISGQMLEHCEEFWSVFQDMARVLAPDGHMVVIAPSAGPIHRFPVDCYRFYPDSFRALARMADLDVVDLFHDDRGPWNDLVGVFRHREATAYSPTVHAGAAWALDQHNLTSGPWDESPEDNTAPPAPHYLEVLGSIHARLQPAGYLEIGVRHGGSLTLAQCPAIGIDPEPDLNVTLAPSATVIQTTSDEFFRNIRPGQLGIEVDLAFIDGMHLVDYALRDFMAIERLGHENTVILIDDVLPNHPRQALRRRQTRVWMGDVWKIVGCLRTWRPELQLTLIDTSPGGLLIVTGLDPNSSVLRSMYNPIVRELLSHDGAVPDDVLGRRDAIAPNSQAFIDLMESTAIRRARRRD